MNRPRRVQRTRKRIQVPEPPARTVDLRVHGAIYVGRPTRWGNPYVVGQGELVWNGEIEGPGAGRFRYGGASWVSQAPLAGGLTAAQAVELYRWDLGWALSIHEDAHPEDRERTLELRAAVALLAGHDLACWCPLDQPCHADVLLELANAGLR